MLAAREVLITGARSWSIENIGNMHAARWVSNVFLYISPACLACTCNWKRVNGPLVIGRGKSSTLKKKNYAQCLGVHVKKETMGEHWLTDQF